MTEFLVYLLIATVLFLLMVLGRASEPRLHRWHEVSSSDLATAERRQKRRSR